ncbi:MAG: response regulator transcription factor [Polyangiaceae bacterium]
MPVQILVVDDDTELCELIGELLADEGFTIEAVHDGAEGLARALAKPYALVVLDVMLPGLTGFEVLAKLRRSSRVPVLMLTARGEDVDRIVGLEMGADDYLPKPFNPRELVARVRAICRRAGHIDGGARVVSVDDIELSHEARSARLRGEELRLTTAEFDLLDCLMQNAGAVVTRDDLALAVLGRKLAAFDRAIDMHVSNLRKKLGPAPSGGERIKTVRNSGYILAKERA